MKKVLSVLLVMVMVMTLVACGKKEEPSDPGKTDVTQAADTKKDAEPTKAAEPTPEPTQAVEPTPEPEPDDDEFASAGHAYEGIWQSIGIVLEIIPEGEADIVRVYNANTDRETYGEWGEYLTSFSPETNSFYAEYGIWYEAADGDIYTDVSDSPMNIKVMGDQLVMGDQFFNKISENPYFQEASSNYGDYGDDEQPTDYISDETALEAIKQYCYDTKLNDLENPDQYDISWIVGDATTDDEIVIEYRSYTGAYVFYYVDRYTGMTHSAEMFPGIIDVPQPTDEEFNALDYWY